MEARVTDTTPENVFNSNLSTLKQFQPKDSMNEQLWTDFNESTPDLFEIPELNQDDKFNVEEFINKGDYDYA